MAGGGGGGKSGGGYENFLMDREWARKYITCGHNSTSSHLFYCETFKCHNHFKCPDSYCIPERHVCDGIWDCPHNDDERSCSNIVCHGLFWCPHERLCLSDRDICDGVVHCRQTKDDELLCDATSCPKEFLNMISL